MKQNNKKKYYFLTSTSHIKEQTFDVHSTTIGWGSKPSQTFPSKGDSLFLDFYTF